MAFRDFLPFQQAPLVRKARKKTASSSSSLAPEDQLALSKAFKVSALALGFQGGGGGSRASFEAPQYDFERILQAIDTDSYIKQGLSKYKELMWKEGWHLVGENPEAVDYIYTRFDFMELVMRRPMQDLLSEIGDQLIKFGNAFVVKSRGDISQFFPAPLQGAASNGQTVIGYYVLPAETVEIARDKNNKVVRYRQNVQGAAGGNPPEFKPEDVIHFMWDRKPGRAFGTPFLVATLDDVVALRQMEEDFQNLVHKELFPLYKYIVGTPEAPAEPQEIDQAANELANLRTDGGLVLPERHDVEVIGADGKALNADTYLAHFKQRVVVGLGIAEHHLGMTTEGGNKAVTDRLDVALYDRIKMFQRYLEDMIRLMIINELLIEGSFDPFLNPMDPNTISDRVLFRFREIDVDTQIKKENHILQKYQGNAITLPETRIDLGDSLAPEVDESELFLAIQARLSPDTVTTTKSDTGSTSPTTVDTTPAGAQKVLPTNASDKGTSSTGGKANQKKSAAKAIGNKDKPANQFTRRISPNVRRDDDTQYWLTEIAELIDGDEL